MKKRQRKKILKKIIALCLAAIMAIAMAVPAMANGFTSDTQGKITINGLEKDATVTGYRIITVNIVEGQPTQPLYLWDSDVAAWLKNNDYGKYVGDKNAVTDEFMKLETDSEELKAVMDKLLIALKKNTFSSVTSITGQAVESGTASITGVPMGYYLISVVGANKIYKATTVLLSPEYVEEVWTVPEKTITMKSQTPAIEKTADKTTVAVGDVVTYTLKVLVPEYPKDAVKKTLIVGDKLGTGLTYQNNVKVYSDEKKTNEILKDNNYSLSPTAKGDAFTITFAETFLENAAYAGKNIYIVYSAKVNADAFTDDALENTAYIRYNDPYIDKDYTTESKEEIYTYIINVTKEDKNNTKLSGAKFTLTKKDGAEPLKFNGSDGVYTYTETGGAAELVVPASGMMTLRGLNVGTYILKETQAPDGYMTPSGEITIIVTDAEPDGTIDAGKNLVTPTGEILLKDRSVTIEKNVISLTVQNTKNDDYTFTLPTTGGMGTAIFTIVGILLMGGAAAMAVVISRRKKHGNK